MRDELQAEMRPDYVSNPFSNEATRWGPGSYEAQAIANIELETGLTLWEPGFVFHPELDYAGASPDFFAEDHISGQIKVPLQPEVPPGDRPRSARADQILSSSSI